jgi:hypothetical protein
MGTPLVLLLALAAAGSPDCIAPAPFAAAPGRPVQAIAAATNVQQAMPSLEVGTRYLVTLAPENRVAFIVAPRRAARDAAPHGGILYFDVRETGRYRFALDTGHWLDVVDQGTNVLDASASRVVEPIGREGAGACTEPRNVFDFDLAARKTYRLHLSGREDARVTVVVARGDATSR